MAKCPKCQNRKGRRYCPALATEICSRCCGEHRLRTIHCPDDCPYLESEKYQRKRRREQACRSGEEFLEFNHNLNQYETEESYNFGVLLQADIYAFMREFGALDDVTIHESLEEVRGANARIVVPVDRPQPLAAYLLNRLENSRRYHSLSLVSQAERQQIMEALARQVKQLGGTGKGETYNYSQLAKRFYDRLDLEADFHFTEEDAAALRTGVGGGVGAEGAFSRRTGGLILPR